MQKYTVNWTDDAVSDFDHIIGYIAREDQTTAKSIYLAIKEQCQDLDYFSFRGRVVPELEALGFVTYREIIYKQWRIIYSVEGRNVYLLLILDSRRDIEEQLVYRVLHHED